MRVHFSLLALSVISAEACLPGWTETEGDYCYLVSSAPMDWHSAQEVSKYEVNVKVKYIYQVKMSIFLAKEMFRSEVYYEYSNNSRTLILQIIVFSVLLG